MWAAFGLGSGGSCFHDFSMGKMNAHEFSMFTWPPGAPFEEGHTRQQTKRSYQENVMASEPDLQKYLLKRPRGASPGSTLEGPPPTHLCVAMLSRG